MNKDMLDHSGVNQKLREKIESSSPVQANSNQQLRSDQNEENAYRSEEHRHVYHNQSQSFNEQRNKYAEQALNESVPMIDNYDYQKSSAPEAESTSDHYQRYVSGDNESKSIGRDSIFASSDFELTTATENYLDKNNDSFTRKIRRTDQRIGRTTDRIERLETNHLQYRNSYKPWKHRLIIDKNGTGSLNESKSWHAKGLIHKDVIHKESTIWSHGRLKFRSEKIALTEKKHNRKVRKAEMKSTRRGYYLRQFNSSLSKTMLGNNYEDDDIPTEMKRKGKKVLRGAGWSAKRNYRKIKHELDGYSRLKFQNTRLASLNAQKTQLAYRSGIDLQKRKATEAARQGFLREKQKRKLKKEMVQNYKQQHGNFLTRTMNQQKMKKTVKKEKRMARKRAKTLISSAFILAMLFFLIIIIFFLFVTVLVNIGGEAVANGVSQNDYYDMTEVTEYFRNKEADLEEEIKPENLEPAILEEYPEIYEFVYELDEISFDANTLIAYLSAKYNEFDPEMVRADLDEIFELYYTLEYEVKEEYRMIPDITQLPDPVTGEYPLINKLVQICYVTLEKADFYELLKSRIEDSAKQNQMNVFYLAGNGQQVYGPVMNVDWRNKISSNYGERVHPITGSRSFHDGVDIAVPVGTALYSAVEGTVVSSYYSDSGGNIVTIENDSGWRITFMHMDSRIIREGDTVIKGQLVGYSGNTGNSTGPHLHIRVHDAEDNPINPVFIIPFSTIEASEM